jgi:hypothetical protein
LQEVLLGGLDGGRTIAKYIRVSEWSKTPADLGPRGWAKPGIILPGRSAGVLLGRVAADDFGQPTKDL